MVKNVLLVFTLFTNTAFASLQSNNSWNLILDKGSIKLFTKDTKEQSIPFKATTIIDGNIEDIVNIISNHKEKHLWAPKLKAVQIHEINKNGVHIFSEFYSTPWPASDRQFLLKGKIERQKDVIIFRAKSIDKKEFIEEDHVVAKIKEITVTLKKIEDQRTKMVFTFNGDMNGWLPRWLKRLIQKKWPYKFIESLKIQLKTVQSIKKVNSLER